MSFFVRLVGVQMWWREIMNYTLIRKERKEELFRVVNLYLLYYKVGY
jgi:hypothetical protein